MTSRTAGTMNTLHEERSPAKVLTVETSGGLPGTTTARTAAPGARKTFPGMDSL
jgi:hypothetical protein